MGSQLGPILENDGTIEQPKTIFTKSRWGGGKRKGCLFIGTGDAKSVRNMKSLQDECLKSLKSREHMANTEGRRRRRSQRRKSWSCIRAMLRLSRRCWKLGHQNMLPIPALFHLQMNFAYAIQKAHDGSKTNNPDATKTSKSTLLWHRSITGIKGAHEDKPEYFTLRDLLVKSFRSRIVAAVLDIEHIPYHTD